MSGCMMCSGMAEGPHHEHNNDNEHSSSLAEQGVGDRRRSQPSIGLTDGDGQIQRNARQPCTAGTALSQIWCWRLCYPRS